jgi:hypothetical protein
VIRPDKTQNALYALNGILIATRAMAYDEQSHVAIAEVLDQVEYLPRLLADNSDKTDEFRAYLVDLVTMNPRFTFVLERFDEPAPQRW